MSKWNIYSSDGKTIRATTKSLEYSGEYMGSCALTISFESKTPINFQIGDYIDYREERFYLNVVPTAKKQCSINGSKDAFVYDNVRFDSVIDELVRCSFLDIVETDSNIHWTALPTFSFYCGGVYDLASRIRANLDKTYGRGVWTIEVSQDALSSIWKDKSISIDNQSVWDALSLMNTDFKTNFIIRGRKITIGTAGASVGHIFKYGVGNGLKSLERTVDDNQKVITRLRAYGNTTNMPTSYYKYLSMYIQPIDFEIKLYDSIFNSFNIDCNDEWAQDANSYGNTPTRYGFLPSLYPNLLQIRYIDKGEEKVANASVFYDGRDDNKKYHWSVINDDFRNWLKANKDAKFQVFGAASLNFNYLLSKYPSVVNHDNYPNNMAVTRLMLPDFSIKIGEKDCSYVDKKYEGYKLVVTKNDVYIDSPQLNNIGLREGSVYIDGTDNETTDYDVYPSLIGMTANELKNAGIYIKLPPNDNGCLDEIASASTITDNGDSDFNKDIKSQMFVWIKNVGFNPWSYRTSESPTIYFKSGMCVGREFDITNCVEENKGDYILYKLTISRKADNELNIVYPNSEFPIRGGDKFVLLHIKMPDIYYQAASQRLLKYALEFFVDNDKTRFAYTPEIDNIWMARQHDEATLKGEKSIYTTIKEGDKMLFDESKDLGFSGSVIINTLKITESEDSLIPTFDITLEDKKTVSSLQRTLNQLSNSIGGSGGGGGLDYGQVNTVIKENGKEYYLSKLENDNAKGLISFDKGIEAFAQESTVAADGIIEYPTITEEE